jgi:hypothetical protein
MILKALEESQFLFKAKRYLSPSMSCVAPLHFYLPKGGQIYLLGYCLLLADTSLSLPIKSAEQSSPPYPSQSISNTGSQITQCPPTKNRQHLAFFVGADFYCCNSCSVNMSLNSMLDR